MEAFLRRWGDYSSSPSVLDEFCGLQHTSWLDMPDNSDVAASLSTLLSALRAMRKEGKLYYCEWARNSEGLRIIQSAPHEDLSAEPLNIEVPAQEPFVRSSDIVNHGAKSATSIVVVHPTAWGLPASDALFEINKEHSNFLLVIPSEVTANMFSSLVFDFEHFFNSAAIYEYTYDDFQPTPLQQMALLNLQAHDFNPRNHQAGGGAKHVRQLLARHDIPYLAAGRNILRYFENQRLKPERIIRDSHGQPIVSIYDVGTLVIADACRREAALYVFT